MTEMLLAFEAILQKQAEQAREDRQVLLEILREVLTDPEVQEADSAYATTRLQAYTHAKKAIYRPRHAVPYVRPHRKGDGRFVQSVMSYLQGE